MDPFDLERFVEAQDAGDTYRRAVQELSAGLKRTHWMWFVFPQIAGLGQSATSRRYAISSPAEAAAYLEHPVLGRRLLESVDALLGSPATANGSSAEEILGSIDAVKLRSSMTLFAEVADDEPAFSRVLARFFAGRRDPATLALLG
jgi:uncharacterized protein (DUF1810 family)